MKQIMLVALVLSTTGLVMTGCGGVSPAPTSSASPAQESAETLAQATEAPSVSAENSPATEEVSQPEVTRGLDWASDIDGTPWPVALNAGKAAQFDGLLKGYDRKQGKWKPFSGNITLTLKDKNGINVLQKALLSGGDGKFSFRVTIPGKKGDYRRATLEFVGNDQFKANSEYRTYTLR